MKNKNIYGVTLFAMVALFSLSGWTEDKQIGSDQSGQKVFEKVQPFAFKVKTSPSADSPQASYGTGFVIDKQGLIISNYHVVSDSIIEPEKNKIFVIVDDKPLPGRILAVDVVHDISLIKIDKTFEKALLVANKKPGQGEPIYAIGQPEDLNMSIVAGTYNNELDFGSYNIIHLSAPINSGMSGGPTVNQNGELIGVNVSKLLSASNVSFSVPARFALELYAKNKDLTKHEGLYWEEIQKQLVDLQQILASDILKSAEQNKRFHGWNLPELPKTLKCWSVGNDTDRKEKELYDTFEETCDLQHSAYLSSAVQSGTYNFSIQNFENKKLNGWQFYELLSGDKMTLAFRDSYYRSFSKKEKLTTKGDCVSKVIVGKNAIPFKVAYCARAYAHFPLLQDAHIGIRSVDGVKDALAADISLAGFTKENISKIVKTYVEQISRGDK